MCFKNILGQFLILLHHEKYSRTAKIGMPTYQSKTFAPNMFSFSIFFWERPQSFISRISEYNQPPNMNNPTRINLSPQHQEQKQNVTQKTYTQDHMTQGIPSKTMWKNTRLTQTKNYPHTLISHHSTEK